MPITRASGATTPATTSALGTGRRGHETCAVRRGGRSLVAPGRCPGCAGGAGVAAVVTASEKLRTLDAAMAPWGEPSPQTVRKMPEPEAAAYHVLAALPRIAAG